jgi:hypothetical protein
VEESHRCTRYTFSDDISGVLDCASMRYDTGNGGMRDVGIYSVKFEVVEPLIV